MNDLISIITICYNCKQSIQRTIESVIAQSYHNIEYIIVDGGSSDGTLDVIKRYTSHISTLVSEPDNGIYDALNKGIALAKGTWILCLNAGDVLASSDVLEKIFSLPVSDNINVLYSDFLLKMLDGGVVHGATSREKGVLLHQSCIYRKSMHSVHGQYIVTRPYIVSDLIFLLSIPTAQYMKVPYEISMNDSGGVSQQGIWCVEEAESAKVAFRIQSIHKAYFNYWYQRIIRMIPYSLRRFIRKYVLKKQ